MHHLPAPLLRLLLLAGVPALLSCTGDTYLPDGRPDPPARLVAVSGDAQVAAAGARLPQPLVVRVEDAAGKPVSGVPVAWQVTGGGGSVEATSSATDGEGLARAGWTLGRVAEENLATASAAGIVLAFRATAVPGPVASVVVAADAATVLVGDSLTLRVTLRDAHGNATPGRPVEWKSSRPELAAVAGSGVVTGVAAGGPVTVTATSEGVTGAIALTVKHPPVVLAGAGDIANCIPPGAEATAALLDRIPGTVVALGDNVYGGGTSAAFASCYHPTWGRHRSRTRPAVGNHEYDTDPGARPYFDYFGAAAGEPGKGYYSYEAGAWHVVVLNSEIPTAAGSAQEKWLRDDLAASGKRCTLAYWHRPRFSSGPHGSDPAMQPLWQALHERGAEVVLSGHDHHYERFAPLAPGGAPDPAGGIRQFVVGTGGAGLYAFPGAPVSGSEVRYNGSYGVLKLTLEEDGYAWEFIPTYGSFTDTGRGVCH